MKGPLPVLDAHALDCRGQGHHPAPEGHRKQIILIPHSELGSLPLTASRPGRAHRSGFSLGPPFPGGPRLPLGAPLPGGPGLPLGAPLSGRARLPLGAPLSGGSRLPLGSPLPGGSPFSGRTGETVRPLGASGPGGTHGTHQTAGALWSRLPLRPLVSYGTGGAALPFGAHRARDPPLPGRAHLPLGSHRPPGARRAGGTAGIGSVLTVHRHRKTPLSYGRSPSQSKRAIPFFALILCQREKKGAGGQCFRLFLLLRKKSIAKPLPNKV